MKDLNLIERRILKVLYLANRPLTTSEVAKKSEISWQTTKKYLDILYFVKTLVHARRVSNKSIYWWLVTERD